MVEHQMWGAVVVKTVTIYTLHKLGAVVRMRVRTICLVFTGVHICNCVATSLSVMVKHTEHVVVTSWCV